MTRPHHDLRVGDSAAAVARAVHYESHGLGPYRTSALASRRRSTSGSVVPRTWSEDGHPDDAWRMRTECLVLTRARSAALRARARFLQIVDRRVARFGEQGLEFVDEVRVGRERWVASEEARERELTAPLLEIRPGAEKIVPLRIPDGIEAEWLEDASGRRAAAVVRGWRELQGELRVACERVADGLFRVAVEVRNTTPWRGTTREDALRSALVSAHMMLEAVDAELVSITDPPEMLAEEAAACEQVGCWPVLVGARGARDKMLVSPFVLPDYPAVPPESPDEPVDAGASDDGDTADLPSEAPEPKAHAPFGSGRARRGPAGGVPDPLWREMGRSTARRVVVNGTPLRPGSRVRLHPRRRGDAMDAALVGRVAIVEGIDQDDAGGVHLTVVVEGDPGRDLGPKRTPGHRFFLRPEEVEPLEEAGW